MGDMNARQRKFCDEYIISGNAADAAKKAGYSSKAARSVGQRLLTNADVSSYIDSQLEALHNEKTADAQEVLEYLTSVMRGEHTEQTLAFVGEGVQEITDIEVSERDRMKAAELIGKRFGMFRDNVSVDVEPVTIVNDLKE